MPIINEYSEVKKIYADAAKRGISLPVFCAEDRETIEAILASVYEYGKSIGVDDLPIIIAWTSRYPGRGQMEHITVTGNAVLGTKMMFSDLKLFMDETSPYKNIRVMPHLDHAFPWLDQDILDDFIDDFASVMCDASEKPFEENIKITSEYVKRVKGRVVVEAAVDEIFEAGSDSMKNKLTTLKQAKRFLKETGVDIIVPNLGTEHRATAGEAKYHSDRAREISSELGSILCLHGTSSLSADEIHKLPQDGIIKVNIYTTIAVHGGQALAQQVLDNLGNVFSKEQLENLVSEGVLGEAVLENSDNTNIGPKLDFVTNPLRRDAWFEAVKNRCLDFYEVLGYGKFI